VAQNPAVMPSPPDSRLANALMIRSRKLVKPSTLPSCAFQYKLPVASKCLA
jgi:hypothetical protein